MFNLAYGVGTAAVDRAAKHCAEWQTLKDAGHPVRQTQERYVELSMDREAKAPTA